MTAGAIIGSGILLRAVAPILLTRWTWAFAGVILSLVMASGYMFTRIRHSPYTGKDGSWIAGGFTNQYGQEVHVIAFVCEYFWVYSSFT
jgi:oligosaccharyltransferase complex subunit gamma